MSRFPDFGDLRGVPYAELTEDPFGPDFAPPNGEDSPTFHARVTEAFDFIVSRRRSVNGTLVVVTRGLVCRALVERHALLSEEVGRDSVLVWLRAPTSANVNRFVCYGSSPGREPRSPPISHIPIRCDGQTPSG